MAKKEAPIFTRPEKRPETRGTGRARGHASREADRASEALHSASSSLQEANPDHAREEPSRTSDATPGRVGGLGQSHWQDTGPSLREPRKGRAPAVRAVSQSSAGTAAEDAQHSRKSGSRRDAPSLPASKSPARSSLNPECGILRPQLHAQPEPRAEVARPIIAGKSHKKVSEKAGRLPKVWKLKWRRVWVPGGVQFLVNTSRGRMGVDTLLLNVGALEFRPPPVGQAQQLQSEKRAAGRQIGSDVEITHEVSALCFC